MATQSVYVFVSHLHRSSEGKKVYCIENASSEFFCFRLMRRIKIKLFQVSSALFHLTCHATLHTLSVSHSYPLSYPPLAHITSRLEQQSHMQRQDMLLLLIEV